MGFALVLKHRAVLTSGAMPDLPAISGHRLVRLLGEGGMGRVYLAEDVVLGRRAAVKVLSERMSGDPDACARFLREARAMAALEHPHVVRVYSFGEAEGAPYLVMEYVQGEALAERIGARGPWASTRRSASCSRSSTALEAAVGGGARPPGHQALEHAPGPQGRGRGWRTSGWRSRFSGRPTRASRDGGHRRHAPLHLARAGAGARGRLPDRRVLPRHRPLRDARPGPGPSGARRRSRSWRSTCTRPSPRRRRSGRTCRRTWCRCSRR